MFDALGYKSWLETLDAQNYLVQKYTLNHMLVEDRTYAQPCLDRYKSGDFLSPARYRWIPEHGRLYIAIMEINHGVLLSGDQVGTDMEWCWVVYVGLIHVD